MRKLICGAMILVVGCGLGLKIEARGVGTSAANFFKSGWSARATGMGGAFVALADDLNSLEWNPAGLSLLTPNMIHGSFEHIFWFGEVEYEILSLGQYLGDVYGGGVQLFFRHMPDIDNDLDEEKPMKVYDVAAIVGYGFQISNFSVGLNIKTFNMHMGTEDLYGEAADLGLLVFFMERKVSLGVAIQNMGPDVKSDSLPLNIRGGFGYKDLYGANKEHGFNAGLELNQPLDNKLKLEIGLEYWYSQLFAARLGYQQQIGGNDLQTDNLSQRLSFGVSARWADMQLDYAFMPFGALGVSHRMALTAHYGPLKDEIEK